ncbi:MAG: tRNA 2-thiouridine(34) synthase MnmA [Pseudomonadota bacterium]
MTTPTSDSTTDSTTDSASDFRSDRASDPEWNPAPAAGAPAAGARVLVGMSGGVDSSVAAALLLEQGYAVEGLFMKNWDEDDGTEYCTAEADLADARRVAEQLGIVLHTANFAHEYWEQVFEAFLAEYAAGRTPNPDVLCNREIKFAQFIDYAETLGATWIATGHYARWQDGRLAKARDGNKDQTYFLQDVPLARLRRCLFPLGELTKPEVRALASRHGFANHAKKDSTGICFIGERRFADFLARYLPERPGAIVTTSGRTLGTHRGLPYYTLGQRQGLGIGGQAGTGDAPWYVCAKDEPRNALVVSQDPRALERDWLRVEGINWLGDPALDPLASPAAPGTLRAKVRYRQPDQDVEISPAADGGALLRFAAPQRAVTPGQYACLYSEDLCLGGGRIVAAGCNA